MLRGRQHPIWKGPARIVLYSLAQCSVEYRSCNFLFMRPTYRSPMLCRCTIHWRQMMRFSNLAVLTVLLGGAVATGAGAQTSAPPPPSTSTQPDPNQDLNCRREAANESGYNGGTDQSSNSAEQRYAAAYYACMSGPPAGTYAAAPPPAPPYYYGPPYAYPYPYYYYPPYYYGPAVTFGFGIGGFHGRWR
jgi:hypothetical protein